MPDEEILKGIPQSEIDAETQLMKWIINSAKEKVRANAAESRASAAEGMLKECGEVLEELLLVEAAVRNCRWPAH